MVGEMTEFNSRRYKGKRFVEIDSKIKGLTVIIDNEDTYSFSPLTKEQNYMFLRALNNLAENCEWLEEKIVDLRVRSGLND